MSKKRLDELLLEKGLAKTIAHAQALIMAGGVLVDNVPATKAGAQINEELEVRLKDSPSQYVSRGAYKLIRALDVFNIQVEGRTALDVGASTGGFTQVLLERNSPKVFALDVGHNQLNWKIRTDPRVVVLEKTNARHLTLQQLGEAVQIVVMDVSFISIEKIMPAITHVVGEGADWITLIKPQFEVPRECVGKGGIVQSDEAKQEAIERVTRSAQAVGIKRLGLIPSPIHGTDGNEEFLAHWQYSS